jgi:hypothetical protein
MSAGVDVGIAVAAVGSIAAAVSAFFSARVVSLSHRPYVYGEHAGGTKLLVGVKLYNSGPGTATEIRCRIVSDTGASAWGAPIRALGPGENLGPRTVFESLNIKVPCGIDGLAYSTYSIETEFGDIRGARWRLRNDRLNSASTARAVRIRSDRLVDRWRPR